MNGAAIYDISVVQGVRCEVVCKLQSSSGNFDLAGFTGKSQIRDKVSGTLMAEFEIIFNLPSTLTLRLSQSVTASLPIGFHFWDLFLADANGVRDRYLRGGVKVEGRVTQWI